ncbi:MAG: hypothetical protein OQL11_14450 [Gammaproteobacteria bacterium]|nr:hypothetical protein [Gammaproteobacteria bacterium]
MRGRGLLALVLGLVLGVLAVQLPDWLRPADEGIAPPTITLPAADPACDPSQTLCSAGDDKRRLALRLKGPVTGLRPFRVELVAAGMKVREVQLEFTMPDMDMGQNRYRLLPEGNGWVGLVTLPICATGRSDWWVTVRVLGDEQQWEAGFPFEMQGR